MIVKILISVLILLLLIIIITKTTIIIIILMSIITLIKTINVMNNILLEKEVIFVKNIVD